MRTKLFLFLIIIFCSCGRKNNRAIENASPIRVIDVLAEPELEITNLSDIATDIEYIPLQTSESSLIRYILDMKAREGKIFIKTNTSELFCFESSGHYLYKLSKSGRGPEEYTYIYDFDVTADNHLLLILTTNRILFYNLSDTGFVYSKTLNLKNEPYNINISPGQKNILLSYGSSSGNVPFRNVLINLNGDTLRTIPNSYRYSKNTKIGFAATFENIQFKSNNSLNFKFWLSDTVFTLNLDNKIVPYLILDSHGKQTTTDALANFSSVQESLSKYLQVNSILETSRYLFYRYYYETGRYRIYDKVSKKIFSIDINPKNQTKWLIDDLTGGVDIEPKFCIDGNIYSWVDAIILKNRVASDGFKNSVVKDTAKKEALKKLADSLDETDNPVLIVVTPKE